MEPADSIDEDIDVAVRFPRIGDYPRNTCLVRRIHGYEAQSIVAVTLEERANGLLALVIHVRTDANGYSASFDVRTNDRWTKATCGAGNQRHTARKIVRRQAHAHERAPLAFVSCRWLRSRLPRLERLTH